MISLSNVKSAAGAMSYYNKDNYYSKDQSTGTSRWTGNGTEQLGLSGEVDPEKFKELLDGNVEDQQLGKIEMNEKGEAENKHRPAIDLTFSAPKTVSILSEVFNDERLRQAHEEAVTDTLSYLEENHIQTRITAEGVTSRVNTNNMVAALFQHNTSRDLDPQTHTHAVVLNLTKQDGDKWRSLTNEEIFDNQKLLGAIYTSKLAQNVKKLGYEVTQTDRHGNFEIVGISEDQKTHFSQRREEIKRSLKERGFDIDNASAYLKEQATLKTRQNKIDVDHDKLIEDWSNRASDIGIDGHALIEASKQRQMLPQSRLSIPRNSETNFDLESQNVMTEHDLSVGQTQTSPDGNSVDSGTSIVQERDELETSESAKKAVYFAIGHHLEREMIIGKQAILTTALEHGSTSVDISEIHREINRLEKQNIIVALPNNEYTTKRLADSEKWTLQHVLTEKVSKAAIMEKDAVERQLSQIEARQRFNYSAGQRESISTILSTKDRYTAIQGLAGTGKTTMLNGLRNIAEKQGYVIRGMAGTGAASKTLSHETGISSETIAMFAIKEKNLQRELIANGEETERKNEIWVFDESSFTGQVTIEEILKLAKNADAKVVFLGDKHQLQAIEAGKPFEILQDNGIKTAQMNQINRQKTSELKEAVSIIVGQDNDNSGQDIQLKQNSKAFDLLDKQNRVIEDKHNLYDAMVNDYMKLSLAERDNTIVITPFNKGRKQINQAIRAEKKKKNELGDDIQISILVSKNLTKAQISTSRFYTKNDIVKFGRQYKNMGIEKGETLEVHEVEQGGNIVLKNKQGMRINWNPEKTKQVEVYEKEQRQLAVGDSIRITRSDDRFKNGESGKVVDIQSNKIIIEDDKGKHTNYDKDELEHWDHAYASTIYASQGSTKQNVYMLIEGGKAEDIKNNEIAAKNLGKIFGNRAFYVGVTRASHQLKIYTDNKALAREAVSVEQDKRSVYNGLSVDKQQPNIDR